MLDSSHAVAQRVAEVSLTAPDDPSVAGVLFLPADEALYCRIHNRLPKLYGTVLHHYEAIIQDRADNSVDVLPVQAAVVASRPRKVSSRRARGSPRGRL